MRVQDKVEDKVQDVAPSSLVGLAPHLPVTWICHYDEFAAFRVTQVCMKSIFPPNRFCGVLDSQNNGSMANMFLADPQ